MLFGDHVLEKNVLEGYFRCLRYNFINHNWPFPLFACCYGLNTTTVML